MKSINFEFLRSNWEDLSSLAAFAEQYTYADPVTALGKLRLFAEQLVEYIYASHGLEKAYQANFNDLLNNTDFSDAIPAVVIDKLHALRMHGNKALHANQGTTNTAAWLLKEAYQLGQWLYLTYAGGAVSDLPEFQELTPETAPGESKARLKREKKAVLQKLAAQEAQMQQLLDDLRETRSQATVARATAAELQQALELAQRSADVLHFSEEETRKHLIDSMLISAGWELENPESVGQEVEVHHQPTETGVGYADYVFYGDDGKPLAVLEAKKTAVNVEKGREQAKCYADGFEEDTGQRPVIFYTNGYDIRIWNDAADEPPRKIYNFYSKDSLEYLHYQRNERQSITDIVPNRDIADRLYQTEAIKRVLERFSAKHRRSLLVQATGTGKTRVAVSICECLIRAKWAKRILFLCDRRELRKQARNVFKEYLPDEPQVIVTRHTSKDKDKRIYLATYPGMMKCFETFDVGFFDLIIADESHRSIYNKYRDLFYYFDALQVGLTATPVDFINRNTFEIFNCESGNPTSNFSYSEAISHSPPYLSSFKVQNVTTQFLREGIKYSEMNEDQRRQLEDQEPDAEAIEYERNKVDKKIFNKDTNRRIIRNLMENGLTIDDNTRLGKSLVFARNHNHAVLLEKIFDELYPQFGGSFCRVIDHYDPRAETLIDEFKDPASQLTIAISVDMLDTGIDVPELVNLVFAKPVFSYVKFWQMIGRGTRLCDDLFGPGKHKREFLIFDHWGNFKYFEHEYQKEEPKDTKSLQQRLFEARLNLLRTAIQAQDTEVLDLAAELILKDINALPEKSIAVREKWRQVKSAANIEVIKAFTASTEAVLSQEIAPLMQWRNVTGHVPAHECDLLICHLQKSLLENSSTFEDLKADLINQVHLLQVGLNPVSAKIDTIEKVKSNAFWSDVTLQKLEKARQELRGIMKYSTAIPTVRQDPKLIDVIEDDGLVQRDHIRPKLSGLELIEYRRRVEKILNDLFDTSEVLQAIKAGRPVSKEQLEELSALVLAQDKTLTLTDLVDYYPSTAQQLANAIRSIVGLDAVEVRKRFEEFAHSQPLNSTQLKFLQMLQNHISRYGSIEIDTLYEAPFTSLDSDGIDGVFPDGRLIDEIFKIIDSFTSETE